MRGEDEGQNRQIKEVRSGAQIEYGGRSGEECDKAGPHQGRSKNMGADERIVR